MRIWCLNYPVSPTQGTEARTALWEALVLNPFGWCAQGAFHHHLPPSERRRLLHQVVLRNFIQCELLRAETPPLLFLPVVSDIWPHPPFLLKGQKFDNGHNYVCTFNVCSDHRCCIHLSIITSSGHSGFKGHPVIIYVYYKHSSCFGLRGWSFCWNLMS